MSVVAANKNQAKYTLKNDNQDMSRLNIVMESFDVAMDGTADGCTLATDLKVVLGYTIIQKSTNQLPLIHNSTLLVSSGLVTINLKTYPLTVAVSGGTGTATLAVPTNTFTARIVLFGISY
jgi:hypothetical protein